MKNQLIFLIVLFIPFYGLAQKAPATFVNYERIPTDIPLFDYDERISSIHLTSDNEFEFWSRPMVSCLTWHEYKGTWTKNNDTILFYDQYEVQENDSKFNLKTILKINFIC